MPKITIGLIVYNEEKNLDEAIKSIYEQNFEDIEILIGNNASTDGSTQIIERYALKDSRIIHINRKENIGALQNWNDLVDRASGEYFVLAGGHDKWSPNYLLNLSKELDENKNTVLAYAKTQWIDSDGKNFYKATTSIDTSGLSVMGKFVSLMFSNQHPVMGMIRTNSIKQTRKQLEIIGSGEIFLQELAPLGDFVLVENERWYRREVRGVENTENGLDRYKRMLFSNKFTRYRFMVLPHLQMMLVYFGLIFILKNISWKMRILLISTYPLIFIKLIFGVFLDIKWGMKNIFKVISK
ncbi:MAG: glycosyltransferase family 2 protein [Sulfurovum sp.]|nr:glycosyltransferase family 2 protein [Sulfurovum sp.]